MLQRNHSKVCARTDRGARGRSRRTVVKPRLEGLESRALLAVAAAPFVPDELLIGFKPGASEAAKAQSRGLVQTVRAEGLDSNALRASGKGDLELEHLP